MVAITNKDRLEKKSVDYLAMIGKWVKAADIVAGEDAIRMAGETYLPRFPDETKQEYNYRKSLAKFTNVYRDTLENLANKPFAREIELAQGTDTKKVTHPAEIEAFIENVDGSNSNISVFASEYFYRGINFAVDFIMVDYPNLKTDGTPRSKADEAALGLRPYWTFISCINVYEIKSKIINGVERFTYVRVFEPANGDEPNRFRELEFDGVTASFKLWKWDGKSDYIPDGGGVITIGFIPLVPFMTGRRKGKSWQFHPPMQDSADLQIKLYRAESNLEYVKTVAAFPMLVGKGVKPTYEGQGADGQGGKIVRLVTGPGVVLYAPFSPSSGTAGDYTYLEPTGASLTFLAQDIKDLKQDLRELGRQPLTVSSGNLTVITTAVAAGKAKTAVKKWAINLTDALSIALYYTALWMGISGYEPSLSVYDGYDDLPDGDNGASLISTLNTNGKLSDKTMYEEFQRRGTLSSEFDYDQEMLRINEQKPVNPDPENPNIGPF
mgnify:CR=1 FL=1